MKRAMLIFVGVLLCLSLCGCGLVADTSELLKAPQLTGEMYSVEKALKESVSGGYILEYPSSGEKRSAIVLDDLDGDGKKEAIAFYSKTDKEEKQMHLNFLLEDSNKYKSVFDFSVTAGGVERIEICDFNGDDKKEIIVGFEIYGNNDKSLVAFKFDSKKISEIMRAEYTNFLCEDVKGDGTKQLLIQKLNEKEQTNSATIYSLIGKTFSKVSSCSLDKNATSVSNMVFAKLSDRRPAVYIDEIKGVGAITEVLVFASDKLTNPLAAQNGDLTKNIRSAGIPFFDINGDGIPEIPVPADDPKAIAGGVNHINWCSFDGNKLSTEQSSFVNINDGYSIVLPKELYGKIEVTKNAENRIRKVYYHDNKSAIGKEIFSIRVVSNDDDSDDFSGEVIAEKNGEKFIIEYKDDIKDSVFTKSELKNMFEFNDF